MKFFQAIIDFFARLFGGGKQEAPQDKGRGDTVSTTTEPKTWEDGADVPADSTVTPVSPTEIDAALPPVIVVGGGVSVGDAPPVVAGQEPLDTPVVAARVPKYLWLLDNGHGKATPGKRSPKFPDGKQFFEYEFTRDIVARIIQGLDALGIRHHNVVPEEEGDISLGERVRRANELPSSLPKFYLSVHSNAAGSDGNWNAAEGIETWFAGSSRKGKNLASAFQRHLIKNLGWKERGIRYHEPVDRAFYVLKHTSMPAVLTENGFYTHLAETTRLMEPATRQQIAQAHIDAIVEIEDKGIDAIITYPIIQKIQKN